MIHDLLAAAFALFLALFLAREVLRGVNGRSIRIRTGRVSRSKAPVFFWTIVALFTLMACGLAAIALCTLTKAFR